MAARWWTSLSIILILFSFIIFAFLSRKPLCIDSKLVDKMDRISDLESSATVYRCGMHKAVPYDEKWSNSLAGLSRRVQRVEKFLESLSPMQGYLHVSVLEHRPWMYKVVGREIYISDTALAIQGPLEKALLKAWLRDKSSPQLQDHPVLEESLTDLLLFAIQGEFKIEDPQFKIQPSIEDVEKWPFVVKSFAGYCRSPWRQLEHQQLCQKDSFEVALKDSNLISLSLRPLFTQAMISAYMKLRPSERHHFLDALPSMLKAFEVNDLGVGFSSVDSDRQSFVELSFEVSAVLKSLIAKDSKFRVGAYKDADLAYEKWTTILATEMLSRGFSDQLSEAQLDHLVALIQVKSDQQIESLSKAALKQRSLTLAVIDQEQIYLMPGVEPIKRSLFGKVRAQRMTLVICGAISLAEIEKYSDITTRLTVIESCDDTPTLNYEGLLQGQIEKFAIQNPEASFVEIHLPSLHLALQRSKVSPQLKLSMNFDEFTFLKVLGWQKPEYDTGLKAFHANSDIEAFKLYRPRNKMN